MSEPQVGKPLIAAVWPETIARWRPMYSWGWSPAHIPGTTACEPTVPARKIAAAPAGSAPMTARWKRSG